MSKEASERNYPPYCELCLVKFMTNQNAYLHFNGPQHQNKVMLAFHRQAQNVSLIWCRICCCELNTEKALDLHNQSPKHKKKEEAYEEIMELKRLYLLEKAQQLSTESIAKENENEKKDDAIKNE